MVYKLRIHPTFYGFLIFVTLMLAGCRLAPCREPSRAASSNETLSDPFESPTHTFKSGTRAKEKRLPPGQSVLIFKYNGERQCGEGEAITLATMEKELAGLHIYSKQIRNDGLMRIAMCGTTTGDANVFEIDSKDLDKAKAHGFRQWTFSK